MTKMLQVTDRQYDWFMSRAREGHSIRTVIDSIIGLVDRLEADLKKYNAWVKATGLPLSVADKAFLDQEKEGQQPPSPQPTSTEAPGE